MIDTLSYLSDRFFYQKQDDLWHIMEEDLDGFLRGDDRAFVITLAYHLSGCSMSKLRLNIYIGRIRFWMTRDGHVALVFKGQVTCHKTKTWSTKWVHRKRWPVIPFKIVRDPDFSPMESL